MHKNERPWKILYVCGFQKYVIQNKKNCERNILWKSCKKLIARMQAALMIRSKVCVWHDIWIYSISVFLRLLIWYGSKKRIARRRRMRREGRLYDLPSNVSVKQLQPFPEYPPGIWVGDLDTSVRKVFCPFFVYLFITHYIKSRDASLDWHFLERKVHFDLWCSNTFNNDKFNFDLCLPRYWLVLITLVWIYFFYMYEYSKVNYDYR